MAARSGHTSTAKLLLAHHADPNVGRVDVGINPLYVVPTLLRCPFLLDFSWIPVLVDFS
jgi:hypothetical protein